MQNSAKKSRAHKVPIAKYESSLKNSELNG